MQDVMPVSPVPARGTDGELSTTIGVGAGRLVGAIQELSLARDLESVMYVVRHAARELTGADGATFVLREGDKCFYADEEAIAPLWKGSRFPMSACISGWTMLHRQSVVIEDIYSDPRIPADAYRPTFVKSLAMVPIRTTDPIGAIGNYWAATHRPSPEHLGLLQALADSTSIAIENVRLYAELEQRVRDRTSELESANRELEAFGHTVSHDLRTPLQGILGYSELLLADPGPLGEERLERLAEISASATRMDALITDLLRLSAAANTDVSRERVELSALAREVIDDLRRAAPERTVDVRIEDGVVAEGDGGLLLAVLANLLGNAWKFTSKVPHARVEFGSEEAPDGRRFFVRDNGVGFDMGHATTIFNDFQRLHAHDDFPGTGIGLATVRRIVSRHGGRVWAESRVGSGSTFYFTLS
jgi:signal transduction histidine kinase